ncbi:MAG TPA: THUMP domain-containing protein [Thermoanaerobaculia bacterium]|nr:THUMP domain-containing protein [Thermoanaerobaculia bacterium]
MPAAPLQLLALTSRELGDLAAAEIEVAGGRVLAIRPASVAFTGDLDCAYRVCLWSRVASRVLLPLVRFPAPDYAAVYRAAREVDWSLHLPRGSTLAVDCRLRRAALSHSHFAALRVKDAVVDRLREVRGERPTIDLARPSVRLSLYVERRQGVLAVDLSGEPLHRRGYRRQGIAAPLKETLAAAILLRAGWPAAAAAGQPLVDPLCGSGTLPIEGALIAADVAPGLRREHWGFLGWGRHRHERWLAVRQDAEMRCRRGLAGRLPPILGSDGDAAAVAVAQANAAAAGVAGIVGFERRSIAEAAPPAGSPPGLVVANPPYGRRLGGAGLPALWAELGRCLKQRFPGWRVAVLSADPELSARLGLRAHRKNVLYNGALRCQLAHYRVAEKP